MTHFENDSGKVSRSYISSVTFSNSGQKMFQKHLKNSADHPHGPGAVLGFKLDNASVSSAAEMRFSHSSRCARL